MFIVLAALVPKQFVAFKVIGYDPVPYTRPDKIPELELKFNPSGSSANGSAKVTVPVPDVIVGVEEAITDLV